MNSLMIGLLVAAIGILNALILWVLTGIRSDITEQNERLNDMSGRVTKLEVGCEYRHKLSKVDNF